MKDKKVVVSVRTVLVVLVVCFVIAMVGAVVGYQTTAAMGQGGLLSVALLLAFKEPSRE